MSGYGLNWINSDPGTSSYNNETNFNDQQTNFGNQQYDVQQKRNVDAAVRQGVSNMLAGPGPGGPDPNAPTVSPATPGPMAPPPAAPIGAGASPNGGWTTPTSSQVASYDALASAPPAHQPLIMQAAQKYNLPPQLLAAVGQQESGFGTTTNWGSVLPSTADAPGYGVQPLGSANLGNIPANIDFTANYLANKGKAAGVNDWTDPNQAALGLQAYNAGGDPNYVANVARYAPSLFPNGAPSGAPGAAAPTGGVSGLWGPQSDQSGQTVMAQNGGFGNRYNPILQQLAQTPGGGQTALSIMGSQNKYDFANAKRGDNYQRLALTALGQGNLDVAKYYAQQGGITLPDSVLQNSGQAKLLSTAALTADRLGGKDDPAWSQRFTRAFVATGGNVGEAFDQAGAPSFNPRMTVQQVYSAATGTMQLLGINPRTGAAQPITDQNGAPVQADIKPAPGMQGMTPAQMANYRRSRLAAMGQDTATNSLPPDQKAAMLDNEMDATMPGWRQTLARAGGGQPAPFATPPTSANPAQVAPGQVPAGTMPAQTVTPPAPAPAQAAPAQAPGPAPAPPPANIPGGSPNQPQSMSNPNQQPPGHPNARWSPKAGGWWERSPNNPGMNVRVG